MTRLPIGRPSLVHHLSIVVVIVCVLDVQVAGALCHCEGGRNCYQCQCDHMEDKCKESTIRDCIREEECLQGISEHMCTSLGGNICETSGCHLQDCTAIFQCTTEDSCNESAETEASPATDENKTTHPTATTRAGPTAETQAILTAGTRTVSTAEMKVSSMALPVTTAKGSTVTHQNDELLPNEKQVPTEIVVPAVVCITAIVLVAICAVMLALYWKFKIKVITETRGNTYTLPAPPCNGDPLYSVIDAWDTPGYIEPPQLTPGYTEPPQLPPSRVPCYQVIESGKVAKTSPYYEIPISPPQSSHKEKHAKDNRENEEDVEPYQEPIKHR